jgi:teichuronic acid biosynthesis glycosyltransferase TuaG
MSNPMVSIIIPAYNSSAFILNTLSSVFAQTYSSFECIIVDDGSTDNTEEIIKQSRYYEERIRYFKLQTNQGAAYARMFAIKHATGKYIAFLDSDDTWEPNKLSLQIEWMETHDYAFTCTSFYKSDSTKNNRLKISKAKVKYDYNEILKNSPGNSTVIYNRQLVGKIEIPHIKRRNDYMFFLQIIKRTQFLYGLDLPLSTYTIRQNSLSSSKIKLLKYQWKVLYEYEKIGLFRSISVMIYIISRKVFNNN